MKGESKVAVIVITTLLIILKMGHIIGNQENETVSSYVVETSERLLKWSKVEDIYLKGVVIVLVKHIEEGLAKIIVDYIHSKEGEEMLKGIVCVYISYIIIKI